MSFMQKQITSSRKWYEVETRQGIWFVDYADAGENPDAKDLKQFCEGVPVSWDVIIGYGCRLSAPGYLDCTDWAVFPTVAECNEYLNDMYPEDEEDEESENSI